MFRDFAGAGELVALASRLPRPRQLYSDGFTLRARASITVLTHSFTKSCAAWLAQPTPWVSNPSRYPAVTREAALSRSAARHLFAAAARLYSQRHAPSSVSRRRSRRRPLSCFARRPYFAAARVKQDERQNPRRQADGRHEEKTSRATKEPDELPLLEVRPAEARARLPLPAAGREGPDCACGAHQERGGPGRNGRAVGRAAFVAGGAGLPRVVRGDTAAAAARGATQLFSGRLGRVAGPVFFW